MITVIVLAFLAQETTLVRCKSTINQLKHGKGRAVRAIMVLVAWSHAIDHTALGYTSHCMAILTAPLIQLLHVQHFFKKSARAIDNRDYTCKTKSSEA